MENLREIKRHIHAVREIRHITRALKMVAAAKLKHAEERVESARPYARKICEVLVDIASLVPEALHPLLEVREPPGHVGIIVIGSDTGLCGKFNHDIISTALRLAEKVGGKDRVAIFAIGRIARDSFKRHGYNVTHEYVGPKRAATFARAQSIAREIIRLHAQRALDEVYIVYERFYSALEQKPRVFRLIPVAPPKENGDSAGKSQRGAFLFAPSPDEILEHLVSRYVETTIYRALLESDASERGARMTAMTNATDNATSMIEELTLKYHRARQGAITRELAEVVAGAEAVE